MNGKSDVIRSLHLTTDDCQTPDCDCLYNLLKHLSDNQLWFKRSYDSVYINSCCLDSASFRMARIPI